MSDGSLLTNLFQPATQIRKVHSDRDQLLADNEGQAGLNLRVEPDMQESWTQLQEKVHVWVVHVHVHVLAICSIECARDYIETCLYVIMGFLRSLRFVLYIHVVLRDASTED